MTSNAERRCAQPDGGLRDHSHTCALPLAELRSLFAQAGLPPRRETYYDVRANLDGS